jgi:integrase/recombinase XerD
MTEKAISPLRRRLVEDMTVRGFTPATQRGYVRTVANLTSFFGRPPDQAGAGDLRRYKVQMRSQGASTTTMAARISIGPSGLTLPV